MNSTPRVTMVCTGNICRSPAMEYVAQNLWGPSAEVTSAGIYAEIGMEVPLPMLNAAVRHGITIGHHRPAQLDYATLAESDLVLVATQQHARWAEREWGERAPHVFGLKEAVALSRQADAPVGATPQTRLESTAFTLDAVRLDAPVPLESLDDPYGGDQDMFDRVMDEIVDDLEELTAWGGLADR
ncbi:arsenate-mycothiol transferase ArsC [Demequina sediminicola]|uniref:arsenate-mycothiol transferase ArsC n=1 Tax=Demequina sediminicola TaxID=1095026 RepID=UPI000781DB1A|nr:low molecular weight phosphatase family protein [Demequina sediminicola]